MGSAPMRRPAPLPTVRDLRLGAVVTTHLAIGTRKGLWLARDDDSAGWSLTGPHWLMQEVPAVAWDVAAGNGSPRLLVGVRTEHWGPTVASSDDLGGSWQEPDHGAIRFPEDTEAALERVWQLVPDPQRPGRVWAGCEPHSLWRSDDGGRAFTLNQALWEHPHKEHWFPGGGGACLHTILIDPHDDQRVLVALSTGGVYRSSDAGESWQAASRGIRADFLPGAEPDHGQCVHKVARDAGDPQRLYAQNHGGVYRTDDGGERWLPIDEGLPADFGFTVLAHPTTPGTAWVIPLVADVHRLPPDGQLRVWRTTDAGTTWAPSESGLPDDYWGTVLRDAACVTAGDQETALLFVGTRDGWVYASSDEGRTFTEVARHLPDVLSVRAVRV